MVSLIMQLGKKVGYGYGKPYRSCSLEVVWQVRHDYHPSISGASTPGRYKSRSSSCHTNDVVWLSKPLSLSYPWIKADL